MVYHQWPPTVSVAHPGWWVSQSKYPGPPGLEDRLCLQAGGQSSAAHFAFSVVEGDADGV